MSICLLSALQNLSSALRMLTFFTNDSTAFEAHLFEYCCCKLSIAASTYVFSSLPNFHPSKFFTEPSGAPKTLMTATSTATSIKADWKVIRHTTAKS